MTGWPHDSPTGQPCSRSGPSWAAGSTSASACSSAIRLPARSGLDLDVGRLGRAPIGEGRLDAQGGTGSGLGPPAGDLAGLDLLVEGDDGVDQRLRAGRAAGGVDVDGDDLIDALHDGVVVE